MHILSMLAALVLLVMAAPIIAWELYQDGDIADLINEL